MTPKGEITKIAREFEYRLIEVALLAMQKLLEVYKRKVTRKGYEMDRMKLIEIVVQHLENLR